MNEPVRRLHPLLELTKARLREFLREPGSVFWVFGFPLLMALGLGAAFRDRRPEPPRIALVGAEQSGLVRALERNKRVSAERMTRDEAERALARAKVDLIVDASAGVPRLEFDAAAERTPLARALTQDALQEAAGRTNPLRLEERRVTKLGARYVDFLLPGLIGLNLMGSSMWGVGYNLVLARKRRLLRRYAVTPMRRSHFLLSYFFSRCCFLGLELFVLISFGRLVFGTRVQGDIPSLVLASFIASASFAAVSLVIGARLDNTDAANGWMNFVQLPMWLLSGSFFSYERFPTWLRIPIRFLPLTATNDALRAIYNDGASLFGCGRELAVLGVWCVVGFFFAVRFFRWH